MKAVQRTLAVYGSTDLWKEKVVDDQSDEDRAKSWQDEPEKRTVKMKQLKCITTGALKEVIDWRG